MGKFAEKFLNMMRLNDIDEYDDYYYYDDYEEEYDEDEYYDDVDEFDDETEEAEEEEVKKVRKPFISFKRKKKEEAPEEEIEEYADEENEDDQAQVIRFKSNTGEGEIVKVIRPQTFNEAQLVADFLKEGKTIVVNLEGIEIGQAQRIIDFIGGASFAVDGTLKAISNNIFIVAPGNIEVSGDLRDEIVNDEMLSPELTKF